MLTILFVCTGNTCRSPLAEALLRHELQDRNPGFELSVISAGLSVYRGDSVAETVVKMLNDEKIEIDAGRPAVQLNSDLVSEADLILTMTANQLKQVAIRFPQAVSKVYLFKEYCGLGSGDLEDPFGKSPENYRLVMEEIRVGVKNLMTKLEEG